MCIYKKQFFLNKNKKQKNYQSHTGGQYSCIVVPHSPGATEDLAVSEILGRILIHCLSEKSKCYSFFIRGVKLL